MNIVHNREYLYTTVLFYCFGTVRPNADNSVYEIAILVLYIAIDLIVKRSDKLMQASFGMLALLYSFFDRLNFSHLSSHFSLTFNG